ncbi:MAG: nuclear transport factor 2 family protein [Dehalococcoidia bacterium]
MQAIGAGDVDGILSDYTEDSVLMTPDGTLRGIAAIRGLFEQFVGELLPPGSPIDLKRQEIEGEYAYILWSAESDKISIPTGTDTFVIRDGKIAFQTFAGHMIPKG